MKELELSWLKKVSWASHFGNIFMDSSVMADILNRTAFTLLSLIICAFFDFFLICMFDKLNRFL